MAKAQQAKPLKDGAAKQSPAAKRDGRGGARAGAGRKPGSGAFGEQTEPMRIPLSLLPQIESALERMREGVDGAKSAGKTLSSVKPSKLSLQIPLLAPGAKAALQASIGKGLDLGALFGRSVKNAYAMRVRDASMAEAGILEGDHALLDRSQKPVDGKIVAAMINQQLCLRRLRVTAQGASLLPEGKGVKKTAKSIEELEIFACVSALARKY